jgi:hypothetical protein
LIWHEDCRTSSWLLQATHGDRRNFTSFAVDADAGDWDRRSRAECAVCGVKCGSERSIERSIVLRVHYRSMWLCRECFDTPELLAWIGVVPPFPNPDSLRQVRQKNQ